MAGSKPLLSTIRGAASRIGDAHEHYSLLSARVASVVASHIERSLKDWTPMLDRQVIDSLFPADLPTPEQLEQQYPPRQVPRVRW